MKKAIAIGLMWVSMSLSAQVDTLRFYSDAFGTEREVYVHLPEFYAYQAKDFPNPFIYVLDGQHEWFAEPVRNDIRYLQYTHDIPLAITVFIPHIDRVKECAIIEPGVSQPMHRFLTDELPLQLEKYSPSTHRVLIGHSFTASFALYSFGLSPDFYSGVMAHSPLDKLSSSLKAIKRKRYNDVYLSIGSTMMTKDGYHRARFDSITEPYRDLIPHIYTYPSAGHTSLPVLANAQMLSEFYLPFSTRVDSIAKVDLNYQLVEAPMVVPDEMEKIGNAERLSGLYYPLQLNEINGVASRYYASNYFEHTEHVMKYGIRWYPNYYEFHLFLAELIQYTEPISAIEHGELALELYDQYEKGAQDYHEYRNEIVQFLDSIEP